MLRVGALARTGGRQRPVPSTAHRTPWKAKLAAWHAKVAAAYNTDPAYLDMQLGAFIANVSVGTPPQTFHVVMDTGSTPFWVVDSKCVSTDRKGQPDSGYVKNRFDKSNSSTFKNLGRDVDIEYVTGVAQGVLVEDTLKFGSIVDTKQSFGLMTQLDDDLGYMPVDGFFGLGFPGWSDWDVEPPVWKVLKELEQPLFTVWLGNFTIGNRTFGNHESLTADTGTSWINLPDDVVDVVVAAVGAKHDDKKEMFVLDDCEKQGLPELVFNTGGRPYPLGPEDYLLPLASGKCALKVYPKDVIGDWLVGDTFMRRYCHAYDIGQRRIGFAKALN